MNKNYLQVKKRRLRSSITLYYVLYVLELLYIKSIFWVPLNLVAAKSLLKVNTRRMSDTVMLRTETQD